MTVHNEVNAFAAMSAGNVKSSVSEQKVAMQNGKNADDFKKAFEIADGGSSNNSSGFNEKAAAIETVADKPVEETAATELGGKSNKLRDAMLKEIAMMKSGMDKDLTESITDEVISALQTMLFNLSMTIKEELGVTSEELNTALTELGMTETDLLNTDNLTGLVVELKADGDFTELLSNEELHGKVALLNEKVQEFKEEFAREFNLDIESLGRIAEDVINEKVVKTEQTYKGISSENVSLEGQNHIGSREPIESIRVTAGNTGDTAGDETESSASYEQSSAILGEVVSKLEQAVTEIADDSTQVQIVRQVIEKLQIHNSEDITSMELQLTPEELGKVNLQVLTKDGAVTAKIATETLIAKEAIESQIEVLRENLNNQGIEIEAVEVTVATHQFEANDEKQRERNNESNQAGRQNSRFRGIDELEEEQPDEAIALAREIMMSNGNRMDIRT